jgi:hypothetical protein
VEPLEQGQASLSRLNFYDQFDEHCVPTFFIGFFWGKVELLLGEVPLSDSSSDVSVNSQIWVDAVPCNDWIDVESYNYFFPAY